MLNKISLGFLFLFSVFTNNIYGQTIVAQDATRNPIITAVPFLTIAPDARSAGMGDVGVAISTDMNAIHWNPAKLPFADQKMAFGISYTPWLQKLTGDMSLTYLSGYKKISNNEAIAVSFMYFDLGDLQWTDEFGLPTGDFNPKELSVDITYARKLTQKFSVGATLRYFHSNLAGNFIAGNSTLDTRPANSASVDISMFYNNDKIQIAGYNANFAWGINISNIGPKITYTDDSSKDFIPTNMRIGTALTAELDPYNKLTFAFDINKLLVPTPGISGTTIADDSMLAGIFKSFGDAPNGFSEEIKELNFAVGLEYWYNDLFAARTGYFSEHKLKGNRQYFTLGVGLRYQQFGIDFAYLIVKQRNHPLEDTLRFSLIFNLNKTSAKGINN